MGSLSGAGSTFVVPLVSTWTQSTTARQVSYSGIGSGGGIAAITARSVDFGASDAPLTPDQATGLQGLRPDSLGVLCRIDPLQREAASATG